MTTFSPEELKRYNRQLILEEIGSAGQLKLKSAKVLVIGAGGLGCPSLQYLAAAGVGTIGIVDYDVVSLSNLHRQILFNEAMAGKNKATMAKEVLSKSNPFIKIEAHSIRLTNKNALELLEGYDIVLDGTDNFSTRYVINDACQILSKPLVSASMFKFEGQLSVFHLTESSPTYRCLYPEPPLDADVPNCSEIGVLGVLPGILGCLQASEAFKIITGIGQPLDGMVLNYNNLNQQFIKLTLTKNYTKTLTDIEFKKNNYNFNENCNMKTYDISPEELKQNIENYRCIDVREPFEEPDFPNEKVERIPLSEIRAIDDLNLNEDEKTVIICRSGVRSMNLINQIEQVAPGRFQLFNLRGGIISYV